MTFYITTPIYYVNAAPHLGHAYSAIGADIVARHMRQRGEEVFFLTGTDEHGEPVVDAAEAAGVSPRELVDRNARHFEALMPQLNVTNDFFIRTSDERHHRAVQSIMQRIFDNGYIYSGQYEGLYCPRCADFKTDAEVTKDQCCPIHKIKLEQQHEDNYFFKLSAFQESLERLYEENQAFVLPQHRYNEALAFIKRGLTDVSVSRSKLTWGVKVPWDQEHVFYVWFDALLNYVTALSFVDPAEDRTEKFWPANLQIMAKDILKFHAIYWPAILMAAGLDLPRQLFIHGYLLMDGHKMSKSLGNVLDPFKVLDHFGADALRFYLLRDVTFGQDGTVSTTGLETRYETELANEYGNLASRTLAMICRYCDGITPAALFDSTELGKGIVELPAAVAEAIDKAKLTEALELIWQQVRRLNQYVEEAAPWRLAKDPQQRGDLERTLATLAEGLRVVTVLLYPYMPTATEELLAALGYEGQTDYALAKFSPHNGGVSVKKIPPLFPKHDA